MASEKDRALFGPFLTAKLRDQEGDEEYEAFCPLHEDPATSKSPSASINFVKNFWYCFVCMPEGWETQLPALRKNYKKRKKEGFVPGEAPESFRKNYKPRGSRQVKPLTEEMISDWEENLWDDPVLVRDFQEKRLISEETMRNWRIGHSRIRNAYAFPILSKDGDLLNARLYRMDPPPGKAKYYYYEGKRETYLFGAYKFEPVNGTVILFEGEFDAILARQDGLPAITHTAGAGNWEDDWNDFFNGLDVYVAYDNDEAGDNGFKLVQRKLRGHANFVKRLVAPDGAKDYTDYRRNSGSVHEFFTFEPAAGSGDPVGTGEDAPSGDDVPNNRNDLPKLTLAETQSAEYTGKDVQVDCSSMGKIEPAFVVPKDVEVRCGQDKGEVCRSCPLGGKGGNGLLQIGIRRDEVDKIASFTDINADKVRGNVRKIGKLGCSDRWSMKILDEWTVERIIATEIVDHTSDEAKTPFTRTIYAVDHYDTEVNKPIRMVGRQIPHHKNQVGLFVAHNLEQLEQSIDSFSMTDEIAEELKVFRPEPGETPLEKMKIISDDLANNVTQIYGRTPLHLAFDLVWHSVGSFNFNGQPQPKGWLEMICMGDTRTGKSEIAKQLMNWYKNGVLKTCEGSTLAGIIGGAQQLESSWQITWGVIPMNDRKLVILDEASGLADKGIIDQMSSIRSSGVAQLSKIKTGEANARTRLIWISNPKTGQDVDEYIRGGFAAVQELFPNKEDVARFDFAMSASSREVPGDEINKKHAPPGYTPYTSDRCSQLVAWVWSRTRDQVVWADGVESYILDESKKLGGKFSREFPVVQEENVRFKIARIAVAVAGRTFSSTEDYENILVNKEHVDSAIRFLQVIYSSPHFGYTRFSSRFKEMEQKSAENYREIRRYLTEETTGQNFIRYIGDGGNGRFNERQTKTMDRMEFEGAVRKLTDAHMIIPEGAWFRMTATLRDIIREVTSGTAQEEVITL